MNYKVVLLGSAFTGKSSMTHRLVYNKFSHQTEATVGASFFKKVINIDGTDIALNLWDSSGSMKFSSLLPMYVKGAHVILFVYDITKLESFNRINTILLDVKRNINIEDIIMVLVGNKSDLVKRIVIYEEAKTYAKQNNMLFFECSACTGDNIIELFTEIANQLLIKKSININNSNLNNVIKLDTQKETNCCY